jgi:hypothetical protein
MDILAGISTCTCEDKHIQTEVVEPTTLTVTSPVHALAWHQLALTVTWCYCTNHMKLNIVLF